MKLAGPVRSLFERRSQHVPGHPGVRFPIWAQMTILVLIMSIVSVVVLVVLMGVKVWEYTTQLMEERLGNYAALVAGQAETLFSADAIQYRSRLSDKVAPVMYSHLKGNVSDSQLLQMEADVNQYFGADDMVKGIVLYNLDQSYLYSYQQFSGFLEAISYQLPFSNSTTASVALSYLSINQASSNGSRFYNSSYEYDTSPNGYIVDPAPFEIRTSGFKNYTYSITLPVGYLTEDGTETVGYATIVLLSYTLSQIAPTSRSSHLLKDADLYLIKVLDSNSFKYILPNDIVEDITRVYGASDLPVVTDCFALQRSYSRNPGYNSSDTSNITSLAPGHALMRTKTPANSKASVGYSFANVYNEKWFFLVSTPQKESYTQVVHMRNIVIGVGFGVVGAIFLLVIPLSRWQTAPIYRIYNNMGFEPRWIGPRNFTRKVGEDNVYEDGLDGPFGSESTSNRDPRDEPPDPSPGLAPIQEKTLKRNYTAPRRHSVRSRGNGGHVVQGDADDEEEDIGEDLEVSQSFDDSDSNDKEASVGLGNSQSSFVGSSSFHIPSRLPPFKRWWTDELDELIAEYNVMVDKLNNQYLYLEDQVKIRTEEAQEARLLAEAANEAKTEFIANITHELRTPLNGIMGMTSVSVAETNMTKLRASLITIIDSGKVLVELLSELLAFSKSQVGVEPVVQQFTPLELLLGLQNIFKARAETKSVTFTMASVPSNLESVMLTGDSERTLQTCMNIMSNAMKFSEAGGSVSVIVQMLSRPDSYISLEPYKKSPLGPSVAMLEILITDTGVGMDTTRLARIFDLFVQGDNTLSKKHKGTGLGMSMSRQLAEGIGGYIAVFSAENVGSTVAVRIPVGCSLDSISLAALEAPPLEFNVPNVYMTNSLKAGNVTRVTTQRATVNQWRASRTPSLSNQGSLSSSSHNGHSSLNDVPSPPPPIPSPRGSKAAFRLLHSRHVSLDIRPPGKSALSDDVTGGSSRTEIGKHRAGAPSMDALSTKTAPNVQSSPLTGPAIGAGALRTSQNRMSLLSLSNTSNASLVTAPEAPSLVFGSSQDRHHSQGHRSKHSYSYSYGRNRTRTHSNSNSQGSAQPSNMSGTTTSRHTSRDSADNADAINLSKNMRILVADDNTLNLQIIVRMLQQLGVQRIDTAADGETVIKLVERSIIAGEHYRIIFMDLAMPRTNGIEATNFIRGTLGYPYPIIALTGFSDRQTVQACRDANIQEVLPKPVMKQQLLNALVKYASSDKH